VAQPIRPRHPATRTLADVSAAVGGAGTGLRGHGPFEAGPLEHMDTATDRVVTGVALDSGAVQPGDLFVALPGAHGHGADHAADALAAGAVAVLTDEPGRGRAAATGLPVLVTSDLRRRLGAAAAAVYGTRDLPFPLFGVTGTNGKTSTVHLLAALMQGIGWRTAMSSTAERHVAGVQVPSRLTTPEAPELHAFLATAVEAGVDGAALEVSAQGLSRHRVDGVRFDVVGFTNLSHDHLDDYADMDDYLAAKAALFRTERARCGVASLDSHAGARIVRTADVPVATITSRADTSADWHVRVIEQRADRTRFCLHGPDGRSLTTEVPLLGVHMAANTGLAIVMLVEAGVPFDALADALGPRLDVVIPGRMSDASAPTGPRVFVDFAHTPDAFAKSLAAVRAFTRGPVVIVLGADGDRDPSKRSAMGHAAATGADTVIVADHHPRFEDPDPIRAAILAGARAAGAHDVVEIADPARAIRRAIAAAGASGAVYWAGPGLTEYRDIRGEHVPYSSFRDARAALAEAGYGDEPAACADHRREDRDR